jgi:hypothetical protein
MRFGAIRQEAVVFAEFTATPKLNVSRTPTGWGMTVADGIANHLSYLKSERATAYDAEIRVRHWILPKLGSMRVALTKSDIQNCLIG